MDDERKTMEMDVIHKIALAYYTNSCRESKQAYTSWFQDIDTDGDEKISRPEFNEFLKEFPQLNLDLFDVLDHDKNGFLDFEEGKVFFYMNYMRDILKCCQCGEYMMGTYFSCVTCYNESSCDESVKPYNLCLTCYGSGVIEHRHIVFLDNYAMLKSMKPGLKKKVVWRNGESNIVDENTSNSSKGKGIVVAKNTSSSTKGKDIVLTQNYSGKDEDKQMVPYKNHSDLKDLKALVKLVTHSFSVGASAVTLASVCSIL